MVSSLPQSDGHSKKLFTQEYHSTIGYMQHHCFIKWNNKYCV